MEFQETLNRVGAKDDESRKRLQNENLHAKIGLDTAEKNPSKVSWHEGVLAMLGVFKQEDNVPRSFSTRIAADFDADQTSLNLSGGWVGVGAAWRKVD